jgi:hypothetical protein
MNKLLAFYSGGAPDDRGRLLAEITRQDDLWLEVTHGGTEQTNVAGVA